MIYEKPKNEIFASDAKDGEIVDFPNVKRGWGVTENLGFIPPMEYFNAAFNRVDKSLAYQLQRGVGEWDEEIEYPKGAVVSLNGIIYVAKGINTNKSPERDTNTWDTISTINGLGNTFAKLNEDNRFIKNQMVDGYVIANHFHMKMKTQDEFVDGNSEICFRESQPVTTDNPRAFRFMSLNKLKEAVRPQLAASFSESGYVTLDNGLIIQWGKVTGGGEKNFPIAFPRACFTVVAGNADAQGDTADNAFAYPISKEKFYYATKVTNILKTITGYPGNFIAIGW